MSTTTPHHRRRRVPTWLIDSLVSILVTAPVLMHLFSSTGRVSEIGAIVSVLPAVLLWWRRRWPVPVLVACVACFGVAVFASPFNASTVFPTAIAMYTVAVTATRRQVTIIALAVLAVLIPLSVIAVGGNAVAPIVVQVGVSIAFTAALGDGVRSRRAYIDEITARAENAEATRESEAARRVAEERLRIARDLHDIVAHQITVISLHAGAASAQLATRPDEAQASLSTVRAASRRVLSEIGDLLALLRSADDTPHAPQPSLHQLAGLTTDFREAGLDVTVRREGDLPELPPSTDLVAYRIVQEALTNVLRHGADARAHVLVTSKPGLLRLVITNPIDANRPEPDGTGHGLQGIRERAASVRGTVNIRESGGIFRLEVTLPVREET